MFDIGFTEILIVAVVALIVLGPERLPTALRTVGLWAGRIKRTIGSVQKEISEELRVEEMRRAAKEQQERLESGMETMQRPFHESLRDEILPTGKPEAGQSASQDKTQLEPEPAAEASAAPSPSDTKQS
ncbi:Sec-independent protein translocase protein TatB [Motiliproteus sp. SC1-56]|uniref:Sec-independent protein translocase protein TatB n=1 Tax=Motiliproteus sp. SC1-56 TaxID=2799565 RepID=UPI001A90C7FD|nr:Sec-independent protein translocase protein TatB [Motiliproteus sp. SC1-56]